MAVVAWGEMGRTPRINTSAGRDHWNDVGFALVAGGGLKMGQVVGATTSRAELPVGRPYTLQNMLATLYDNVLGIDPAQTFLDFSGRPRRVLDNEEPAGLHAPVEKKLYSLVFRPKAARHVACRMVVVLKSRIENQRGV